jgi:hypothetical protein
MIELSIISVHEIMLLLNMGLIPVKDIDHLQRKENPSRRMI